LSLENEATLFKDSDEFRPLKETDLFKLALSTPYSTGIGAKDSRGLFCRGKLEGFMRDAR